MNLAKVGQPKMAWYDDSKLATLNLMNSIKKLFGLPNMTRSMIYLSGMAALLGTIL
jgi:hypothetical protein